MGFTDSLKKVIGIEDIEEDEVVTEEELSAAKEKIARENRFSQPRQTSAPSASSFSSFLRCRHPHQHNLVRISSSQRPRLRPRSPLALSFSTRSFCGLI